MMPSALTDIATVIQDHENDESESTTCDFSKIKLKVCFPELPEL
jgi:hypothetical protein